MPGFMREPKICSLIAENFLELFSLMKGYFAENEEVLGLFFSFKAM